MALPKSHQSVPGEHSTKVRDTLPSPTSDGVLTINEAKNISEQDEQVTNGLKIKSDQQQNPFEQTSIENFARQSDDGTPLGTAERISIPEHFEMTQDNSPLTPQSSVSDAQAEEQKTQQQRRGLKDHITQVARPEAMNVNNTYDQGYGEEVPDNLQEDEQLLEDDDAEETYDVQRAHFNQTV